jgi:hypothetical protein
VTQIFFTSKSSDAGLPDGILSNQKYILVNLAGSCEGKCWSILLPFGLFYDHSVYFEAIWYTYFMVIWYVYFSPF